MQDSIICCSFKKNTHFKYNDTQIENIKGWKKIKNIIRKCGYINTKVDFRARNITRDKERDFHNNKGVSSLRT